MRTHAHANNRHLGDINIPNDFAGTHFLSDMLEHVERVLIVVAMNSEGEIRGVIVRDVLHDHVHFYIRRADRTKNPERHAWGIRHTADRQLGLVTIESDAGNDGLFHGVLFIKGNEGSRTLFEAVQHAQRHAIFTGKLDGTNLQYLGAEAGHFQHLFKGDLLQPLRLGHDARIGGVNAIHIGVDLAFVGLECRCQRDAGGIGATTSKGSDIARFIYPLEAGNHHHTPGLEVLADVLRVDLHDARLGVGAVGENTYLAACIRNRRHADLDQRHGQQSDGHLLAGRNHYIQFAGNGSLVDLPSQLDQAVGFTAHSRDHHDDVIAVVTEFLDLRCHLLDALDRAHRGPTKLLYDQRHFIAA